MSARISQVFSEGVNVCKRNTSIYIYKSPHLNLSDLEAIFIQAKLFIHILLHIWIL